MPHLVTVTGNRIPLQHGQEYVLGRGRECDVVVEDGACSRTHVRLVVHRSRDEVCLEDLESHNGTFVDGTLVEGRALVEDGSRIRLGGTIYLVRLSEAAEEARLAETGTFALEDGDDGDVAAGEWGAVGLIGVLSRMMAEGRSARLHVALPEGGEAEVDVRAGEPVAARCGGLEGFNALVKLGRQQSGIYWLTPADDDCERNLTERGDRLLAEIARCLGARILSD